MRSPAGAIRRGFSILLSAGSAARLLLLARVLALASLEVVELALAGLALVMVVVMRLAALLVGSGCHGGSGQWQRQRADCEYDLRLHGVLPYRYTATRPKELTRSGEHRPPRRAFELLLDSALARLVVPLALGLVAIGLRLRLVRRKRGSRGCEQKAGDDRESGLYGDITGRLGVTFDGLLIYAKGGFAFFDGEAKQATTKPGYAPTGTDTFTGWTLGGGAEYFLTRSISLKAEYLHFDFGTQRAYQTTTVADPPTPVGYQFNNWHDVSFDSVKAGIAYHF